MTLYCSNLPNDQDMIKALGSIAVPLPLATGDCCFSGVGDGGQPSVICVERKKIGDLVSCILDGRYLHQLQIARENGADTFCLIVEGECRPNPDDGLLEVPVWGINPRTMRRAQLWEPVKPAMTYSRFDQYLTELDYLAGVIVKGSRDVRETAAIIKALWDNFQTPPSQHNSLKQMFKAPAPIVQLVRPSLVRRVASELPDIGWARSGAVAAHFLSVRQMCEASVEEWRRVPGIGNKIARKVVSAVNSGQTSEQRTLLLNLRCRVVGDA